MEIRATEDPDWTRTAHGTNGRFSVPCFPFGEHTVQAIVAGVGRSTVRPLRVEAGADTQLQLKELLALSGVGPKSIAILGVRFDEFTGGKEAKKSEEVPELSRCSLDNFFEKEIGGDRESWSSAFGELNARADLVGSRSSLHDLLRAHATLEHDQRKLLVRYFFYGTRYNPWSRPSPYLRHPGGSRAHLAGEPTGSTCRCTWRRHEGMVKPLA